MSSEFEPSSWRQQMPPHGQSLVLKPVPIKIRGGMGPLGDPERYRSSNTEAAEASEEGDLAPKSPIDLEEFFGIDWPQDGSLLTSAHPLCRLS